MKTQLRPALWCLVIAILLISSSPIAAQQLKFAEIAHDGRAG